MKQTIRIFIWIGIIVGFPTIIAPIIGFLTLNKLKTASKPEQLRTLAILTLILNSTIAGILMLVINEKDLEVKEFSKEENFDKKVDSLISFNKTMGFLHLIQGVLMMLFAFLVYPTLNDSQSTFTIPVIGNYLEFVLGEGLVLTNTDTLFELPFLPMTASFLLLSAIFHFLIAFPFKKKYRAGLRVGINQFRWYEYALSSSLMIVLISALFGVRDVAVFALIALSNAAMNLFGLDMELLNQGESKVGKKVNWLPFIFGTIIGLAPWLAIAFYIGVNPNLDAVPVFVWFILGTYFVAFNTFPVNMVLQYLGVGKFKDYLHGERGYIVLSLVAKTLLTWLVLFGAFQPS
jgi:hypothetical protein